MGLKLKRDMREYMMNVRAGWGDMMELLEGRFWSGFMLSIPFLEEVRWVREFFFEYRVSPCML